MGNGSLRDLGGQVTKKGSELLDSATKRLVHRFGMSPGVAHAVMAVMALSVAGVIGMGVFGGITPTVLDDGIPEDCRVAVSQAVAKVASVDSDTTQLTNAQDVYSVLTVYGLTDNEIAGVLGNWTAESGIDPTCVEGIYDEPYQIGPRKAEALADHDSYTQGLIDSYPFSVNRAQYRDTDGSYWMGLGLVQITNGNRLKGPADEMGANWYDLDFQMAFYLSQGSMCTTGAKGGRDFWNTYKAECAGSSPAECAAYFARYYEGNTSLAQGRRQSSAEGWASQMGSWSANESFANTVLAMASSLGASASRSTVQQARDKCQSGQRYDNSTMAAAAVSYAWDTKDQGKGNDGTDMYREVHDAVYPGDPWYQSCDRGVACAVKWSGADLNYPAGDTSYQLSYLTSAAASGNRWEHVGDTSSMSISDFQPGDVLVLDGHTFMFVGRQLIEQIHPADAGSGFDSVSASFEQRSPGCGNDTTSILQNGGNDWIGRGVYQVFRCVDPENSTKYRSVGADLSQYSTRGGRAGAGASKGVKAFVQKAMSARGSGYLWSGYVWTGSPNGSAFTCSGLVDFALGFRTNSHWPESLAAKTGTSKSISQLKYGDLVYYSYGGRAIGHVGIYIGNGQIVDSEPGGGVRVRSVTYPGRYVGGGSWF